MSHILKYILLPTPARSSNRISTITFICICLLFGCQDSPTRLTPVSYSQYAEFVEQTDYITDAERYGWSIVQHDVFNYITVEGATWKMPDGKEEVESPSLPVTQVSYNDAIAYCKWANTRLPTYDEYWELIKTDHRPIVTDNILPISDVNLVNIVGNVWDITEPPARILDQVRLAGGSIFCSPATCDGTLRDRALYVDKETGNIHIGFSVIK